MRCAGFVLTGGRSTRMGRDKALLPFENGILLDQMQRLVGQVTDSVHLIGSPHGIPDLYPDIGPLGGIITALRASQTDWSLIVACDLPGLTGNLLESIRNAAAVSEANCILPRTPDGREHPLCAAYHQRALAGLIEAAQSGVYAVKKAIRLTRHEFLDYPDPAPFRNVNTPQDWAAFLETTHAS